MPPTAIYYAMKHRLDADFTRLDREKITHWLMNFRRGTMNIDDCRGGRITTGGAMKFEGTPRQIFWTFIRPCLEDIVDECLTTADGMGRKHSPEIARKGFDETAQLLKAFGQRVFDRMVVIDRALRGNGYPDRVTPYDAKGHISQFASLVDMRCAALKELLPVDTRQAIEKRSEVMMLKPNFHGIGIDLKELGRRFMRFCKSQPNQ